MCLPRQRWMRTCALCQQEKGSLASRSEFTNKITNSFIALIAKERKETSLKLLSEPAGTKPRISVERKLLVKVLWDSVLQEIKALTCQPELLPQEINSFMGLGSRMLQRGWWVSWGLQIFCSSMCAPLILPRETWSNQKGVKRWFSPWSHEWWGSLRQRFMRYPEITNRLAAQSQAMLWFFYDRDF